MADTPDLGSGAVRRGGSSPPSRKFLLLLLFLVSCAPVLQQRSIKVSPDQLPLLEDPTNPLTQQFLAEEIAISEAYFRANSSLLREVSNEIAEWTGRLPAAPIQIGQFQYFTKDIPGLRLPLFLRSASGAQSDAQVILDPNPFCSPSACSLSTFRISPAQTRLAFAVGGKLFIKDLPTERIINTGEDSVYDLVWGLDEQELFFSKLQNGIPNSVLRLNFSAAEKTAVIYTAAGKNAFLLINGATSGAAFFIIEKSADKSAVLRYDFKSGMLKLIKILSAASKIFADEIDGEQIIEMRDPKLDAVSKIFDTRKIAACCVDISLSPSERRSASPLQFTASSLINPAQVFRFNQKNNSLDLIASSKLPLWNSADFTLKLLTATSRDGITKLPITVATSNINSPAPLLVVAYGAYGDEPSTEFQPWLASLLRRGFSVAILHIRGGGWFGDEWHKSGSGDNKRVAIEDCIDSTRFLSDQPFVDRERIYAYGRSAGAFTIAASLSKADGLFKGVILDHPFIDLSRAHAASADDLSEWGSNFNLLPDPIKKLPLLAHQPKALLLTSAADSTVPAWHALRWAALSSNPFTLLDYNFHATHQEEETDFAKFQADAKKVVFLLKALEE
jgi:protease II